MALFLFSGMSSKQLPQQLFLKDLSIIFQLNLCFFLQSIFTLEERIREDPDFNFEPVGVEISVVVSHSPEPDPEQDQELNLDQDPGVERILELLNLDPTETSVSLATKTDSDPTLVS